MDKKKMMNAALVILPMIAVVLAGMANSVTVYTPDLEAPVYCSFFTYIEDVPMSLCMPFAMILGSVCFGVAVIYLFRKTALWLKVIVVCAFCSMTLAVLPIMMQSETYIVPNMLVPILMGVQCLLAYAMIKQPREQKKVEPQRLKTHKK